MNEMVISQMTKHKRACRNAHMFFDDVVSQQIVSLDTYYFTANHDIYSFTQKSRSILPIEK